MSLRFSVITPSYNQGKFLERTIQSVLQQTGAELEYVIFDGGSSDETLTILQNYQDRVKWESSPDEGQGDAVNKGIQATSGDIIAWLNSDDIYYPGALSKVQKIFETHPEVQVVYGDAHHISVHDAIIEPYPTEQWNYRRLKNFCFICQPATFFRRQMVEAYGLLDANLKFCMDYELWLRYGQHTNFYYLPEVLAGSRFYDTNKTLGQRVAVHYEINDMLKRKFTRSPGKWVVAYAAVLVEERSKNGYYSPESFQTQLHRVRDFIREAFQSHRRWRHSRFSPVSVWKIARWVAVSYFRFFWPAPNRQDTHV